MLFFEVSKDTVAKVEKDLADPESTVLPANSVLASSVKNNMKDPTQPGAIVLFFEASQRFVHREVMPMITVLCVPLLLPWCSVWEVPVAGPVDD